MPEGRARSGFMRSVRCTWPAVAFEGARRGRNALGREFLQQQRANPTSVSTSKTSSLRESSASSAARYMRRPSTKLADATLPVRDLTERTCVCLPARGLHPLADAPHLLRLDRRCVEPTGFAVEIDQIAQQCDIALAVETVAAADDRDGTTQRLRRRDGLSHRHQYFAQRRQRRDQLRLVATRLSFDDRDRRFEAVPCAGKSSRADCARPSRTSAPLTRQWARPAHRATARRGRRTPDTKRAATTDLRRCEPTYEDYSLWGRQ